MCPACENNSVFFNNISLYCDKHKEELFEVCASCGHWRKRSDLNRVFCYDGEFKQAVVCSLCGWRTCSICNRNVAWESSTWDSETDSGICMKCYYEKNHIFPHHFKRNVKFIHEDCEVDRKNNLHLGIELEIEPNSKKKNNSIKDAIYGEEKIKDYFDLKEDGSLSLHGMEIVSAPMTYRKIFEHWNSLFSVFKEDYHTTRHCGMHIHIDREYLNDRTKRNLDYILNCFTEFGESIANRNYKNNAYCSAHSDKNRDEWGVCNYSDRYEPVNFENKNTVEIRIFKSTIDFKQFINQVKNLIILIEFCKKHTINYIYNKNNEEMKRLFANFSKKYKFDF